MRTISLIMLISVTLAFIYAQTQRDSYYSQVQSARMQINILQNNLASIPPPEKISPGEKDSVLSYTVSQVSQYRTDIKTAASLPNIWGLRASTGVASLFSDKAGASHSSASLARQKAKSNLGHHIVVLDALTPILEYNPRADLMNPSMTVTDVEARIDATRNGLRSVANELNRIPVHKNDEGVSEITPMISSLQTELNNFEETRDKEAWYKAVQKTQESIIANRQAYWQSMSPLLQSSLHQVNQDLVELESSLQR